MKVPIPFFGLVMKTIETDLVQNFLVIFRRPQDIHRVLITIPITLFISHTVFLKNQPGLAIVTGNLQRPEQIWLVLMTFPVLFISCWAVFSSEFNPVLYTRQIVFIIWTCLVHRLSYGLETLGSPLLTWLSFGALVSFLPFAATGLRPDQIWAKYKADKAAEPKLHPTVVTETKEVA